MIDGVYVMSENRCNFKGMSLPGGFLFDIDDGRVRLFGVHT
jgi:hypothetical protein